MKKKERALQLEIGQKYGVENTIRWLRDQLAEINANIRFLKDERKRLTTHDN